MSTARELLALVCAASIAGCTGRLMTYEAATYPDGGMLDAPGARPSADAFVGNDSGVAAVDSAYPDGGSTSVPDSSTGNEPDAPLGCAETCPASWECDAGSGRCVCPAGSEAVGGVCDALVPADPADRTRTQVCARWEVSATTDGSELWAAGSGGECDPGRLTPEGVRVALARINVYRWLAGLDPVTDDESGRAAAMGCALMMGMNGLSHMPPASWRCYTADGATMAGRSNIGYGFSNLARAVDGFMADTFAPNLGHRRWLLSPRLGRVQLGFSAAGGRAGQCIGVFSGGGVSGAAWSAYPNPGPAPIELAQHVWSFQANSISIAGATVRVSRTSDGASLAVRVTSTPGLGPPPALAFEPDGWRPAVGETYRVTVGGTSVGDIEYETTLVECDS